MPSVILQSLVAQGASQLRHLDAPTQARVRELEAQKQPQPVQMLRRTGLRPYALQGTTIATVSGITPALPFWYELNIHETAANTFVSDIRLFHKGCDHADLFRVEEHTDLDALFAHLEEYDPSDDLVPPAEMLTPSTSNAALALGTARLQMQINQITEHYWALVGTLLNAVATRRA